jgi:hypothetical protein
MTAPSTVVSSPAGPERRAAELARFLELGVRRVVARDHDRSLPSISPGHERLVIVGGRDAAADGI